MGLPPAFHREMTPFAVTPLAVASVMEHGEDEALRGPQRKPRAQEAEQDVFGDKKLFSTFSPLFG